MDTLIETAYVSVWCEVTRPDGSQLTAAEASEMKGYISSRLARSKKAGSVYADASDFDEDGFWLSFDVEQTVYVEPATYDCPASSSCECDIEDVAYETAQDLVDLLGDRYKITYELTSSDIKVDTSEYEYDYNE